MKSDQKVRNLAKDICKLAVQAVTLYSIETDAIIVSGCKDKNRIECTLDGMLDFCFDKNVLELYRRLCRYYYDIDQYSAVEYVYAYRDMWDQECKSFGGVKLKSSLPAIEEVYPKRISVKAGEIGEKKVGWKRNKDIRFHRTK